MSKTGESILRGAHQALAYAKGARDGFVAHVPEQVDVAAIRTRLGLSQGELLHASGSNWMHCRIGSRAVADPMARRARSCA
jgi:hypothetical protein